MENTETKTVRVAIVTDHSISIERVQAYMPSNYVAVNLLCGIAIVGCDSGWSGWVSVQR